ncbi:MAG: FliH/SctL family protein [Phycisphaerae bacterium]|jgi:flagellar biosynthesis/type III secretory pathway protein FliH
MSRTLTVHIERPVTSVSILDGYSGDELSVPGSMNPAAETEQVKLTKDLEAQRSLYSELCRTLDGLIAKLNQSYDEIFVGHKEEIARLSVEIARKILMQKTQDGDYEIESIIKEAIKNAPTQQELVVRLNPEDMANCQKAQQDSSDGTLAGVKLVADPNIGRAECVLESPKGIVKSLIEEHLEQIAKALEKAE